MPDAKLRREVRDHAPLRTDKQHARVHVGHVTHDPIINPTDMDASTETTDRSQNINPGCAESLDNPEVDQGTLIRLARQRASLTQAQLAKQLGVRQSAVSQWEQGKVSPELATRIKLAALLRMPLSDVLPEVTSVPDDAFRDPQVLRLVANFVELPPDTRASIELMILDHAERLRRRR